MNLTRIIKHLKHKAKIRNIDTGQLNSIKFPAFEILDEIELPPGVYELVDIKIKPASKYFLSLILNSTNKHIQYQ